MLGGALARHVRQHRHANRFVVPHLEERERPEMRRRPEENDEEKNSAFDRDGIGHAGPADHRRESTGRATDDDVLRRRALQPHCVDDGVEEDGEGENEGRQPIDRETEDRHREAGEHEAEGQSLLGQDAAGRDRALGGAAHDGVDIGVIPHVERTRRTCADGNAEDGDQAENRIDVARRQHQAGKGGEDHERHAGDLSVSALKRAADAVGAVTRGYSGSYAAAPQGTNRKLYTDENPIGSPTFEEKVKVLTDIDAYLRGKNDKVRQVTASVAASWQVVDILRADGYRVQDIRPMTRINISVMP